MTISVKNFISELANATKDPTMVVNTATDWLEILNSSGSDLSPEVLFEYSTSVSYSSIDSTTNDIDMSDDDDYPGLSRVKSIYFLDSNGKRIEYTNWAFDRNNLTLSLLPTNNDDYVDNVTSAARPSSNYPTIIINWLGELPDIAGDGSITMTKPRITLFRKICIREGIQRILMDQMKFDRYRTLVGRANSYELIAVARDMKAEIELDKSKLTNSNTVKVF
jgi:hypothetical protein